MSTKLNQAERYWIEDMQSNLRLAHAQVKNAEADLKNCLLTILAERGEDTSRQWEFIRDDKDKITEYKHVEEATESNNTDEGDARPGDDREGAAEHIRPSAVVLEQEEVPAT
jgi:hypothetical protein